MKRKLSLILCLCLVLTLVPMDMSFGASYNTSGMDIAEHQYYVATGVVTGSGGGGLNVRKAPNASAGVCAVIKDGTKVYIYSKDYYDGYTQIYYKGYYAYVMTQYIGNIKDITAPSQRKSLGYGQPVKFSGGTGTSSNPYIIKTPAQLNSIRFGMDKYYKLGKDIDLKNWGQWLPIGDTPWYAGRQDQWNASTKGAQTFTGRLDGDGHVIKNMYIYINQDKPLQAQSEAIDDRHFGLFGMLGSNTRSHVVVRNLGLINSKIDVRYNKIGCQFWGYTGTLAGFAGVSTVKNVWTKNGYVKMTINRGTQKKYAQPNSANIQMAGLVGASSEQRYISCANTNNVTFSTKRMGGCGKQAAGITTSGNWLFIEKCFNSGKITMPKTTLNNSNIGGLISWLCDPVTYSSDKGHIYDSYNVGTISGGYYSGGLFGRSDTGIILKRCYNTGSIKNAKYKGSLYSSVSDIKSKSNCYTSGNSVSGDAWKYSSSKGRKILKSIPETSLPTSKK